MTDLPWSWREYSAWPKLTAGDTTKVTRGEWHSHLTANDTEADTCFQKALSVARAQQAKFWDLRAATSLARLWQAQGKRQESSNLLAPVSDSCMTPFSTPG